MGIYYETVSLIEIFYVCCMFANGSHMDFEMSARMDFQNKGFRKVT